MAHNILLNLLFRNLHVGSLEKWFGEVLTRPYHKVRGGRAEQRERGRSM